MRSILTNISLAIALGFAPLFTGCADDADPGEVIFDNDLDRDGRPEGPLVMVNDGFIDNFDDANIDLVTEPTIAFLLSRIPPNFADSVGSYCIVNLSMGFDCVMAAPQPLSRLWEEDDITILQTRVSAATPSSCFIVRNVSASETDPDAWSQAWIDENIATTFDLEDPAAVQVTKTNPATGDSGSFIGHGVVLDTDGTAANRPACQAVSD